MWIRSQGKALLIDADRFFVDEESDGRSYIYVNGNPVASYSTHERAMKVMDMIEDAIIDYESMMNNKDGFFNERRIVFQMPTDNVVTAMMEV